MRNFIFLFLAAVLVTSFASAQSRMEAGIFLDALSISQTGTSNFGLGARFGYRIHHGVLLEAELAYDYGLNFHEAFVNLANGDIVAIESTSIGVTHGLIGPRIQPAHGHFRPFATMKAGFIDFRLSTSLLPYSSIVSSVVGLRTSNVNAALYPAGGVEVTLGPLSGSDSKPAMRCTSTEARTTTCELHLVPLCDFELIGRSVPRACIRIERGRRSGRSHHKGLRT